MPLPHCSPAVWPSGIPQARFASRIRTDEPDACRIALIGLADDGGVRLNGGRTGARDGPAAFRAALARYGVAEPFDMEGTTLESRATGSRAASAPAYPLIYDAGDVTPGASLDETHARVTEATRAAVALGLFPIVIGGGHDLTFPFVRGVVEAGTTLDGVYFDAHLDVRAEPGSGMPFRALVEQCGVQRLTCVGLNPLVNTREHFEWFEASGGRALRAGDLYRLHAGGRSPTPAASAAAEGIQRDPGLFGGRRDLFVSFDLDVLDAACAPGVSAPNPAGMSPAEAARHVYDAGRSPRVRCFDIMELCPPHDEGGRTARLAAHLFLAFLRGFAERQDLPSPERK